MIITNASTEYDCNLVELIESHNFSESKAYSNKELFKMCNRCNKYLCFIVQYIPNV